MWPFKELKPTNPELFNIATDEGRIAALKEARDKAKHSVEDDKEDKLI